MSPNRLFTEGTSDEIREQKYAYLEDYIVKAMRERSRDLGTTKIAGYKKLAPILFPEVEKLLGVRETAWNSYIAARRSR